MTDSKPPRRASSLAWGAGLAAVLLLAATGGWSLGFWAERGDATAVEAAGPVDQPGQSGTGSQTAGQRSNQPPRQPQVSDLLPPVRWRWWRDEALQKEVGLTAAQVQRLDAIVKEREEALTPFIKDWFHQRDLLRQMALERRVSVDEFAVQAARFNALESKLGESRTIMLYRMSRELTDEQYRKLQEVRDRRAGRGGRGNPPNR